MLKAKDIRLIASGILNDLKGKTRCWSGELSGKDAFYDHREDVVRQYRRQFHLPAPSRYAETSTGGVRGS